MNVLITVCFFTKFFCTVPHTIKETTTASVPAFWTMNGGYATAWVKLLVNSVMILSQLITGYRILLQDLATVPSRRPSSTTRWKNITPLNICSRVQIRKLAMSKRQDRRQLNLAIMTVMIMNVFLARLLLNKRKDLLHLIPAWMLVPKVFTLTKHKDNNRQHMKDNWSAFWFLLDKTGQLILQPFDGCKLHVKCKLRGLLLGSCIYINIILISF
jgi:hypothetical protein